MREFILGELVAFSNLCVVYLSLLVCFEGLANKILSARFWIPLSRLTYCAYLVHILAIVALYGSFETVQAYSDVHIVSCVDFMVRNIEKLKRTAVSGINLHQSRKQTSQEP